MSMIDFSSLRPVRKPTRKEAALYRRWVKYLSDSRLSVEEIHRRAAQLVQSRREPRP